MYESNEKRLAEYIDVALKSNPGVWINCPDLVIKIRLRFGSSSMKIRKILEDYRLAKMIEVSGDYEAIKYVGKS